MKRSSGKNSFQNDVGQSQYYDSSNIDHNTNAHKVPLTNITNLRAGYAQSTTPKSNLLNSNSNHSSSNSVAQAGAPGKPTKLLYFSDSRETPKQQQQQLLQQQSSQSQSGVQQQQLKNDSSQYRSFQISDHHQSQQLQQNGYPELQQLTLDQINDELDENMNGLITLMSRRKELVQTKKRRLLLDFNDKHEQLLTLNITTIADELKQLNEHCLNQNVLKLQQTVISQSSPRRQRIYKEFSMDMQNDIQEKNKIEISRSQDFWNTNKQFENEIDTLLAQLRFLDQDLEKANTEILGVCKKIDQIEENIRDLLVNKSDENNIRRAELMFDQKQNQIMSLKGMISQRNKSKDSKIQAIYCIVKLLTQLKNLRQERLRDLRFILGKDDDSESPDEKINCYNELIEQLENLTKVKEFYNEIEDQEFTIVKDIDVCSKQSEDFFLEFVRKSSDEAKMFSEFSESLSRRMGVKLLIDYFLNFASLKGNVFNDNIKDMLNRANSNLVFIRPLIEEDTSIKQGFKKTSDTIQTFQNILCAIENEKERRKDLLKIIENCHKLKDQEEISNEEIRCIELEIAKKQQQKHHLEEDLENSLGEADLDLFKKLGQVLKNHENSLQQLTESQNQIFQGIYKIQAEFIGQMDIIKRDFDDIIKELLPSNLISTMDFKDSKDVKQVKNYLQKTFNRLGITLEDSQP